MTRAPNRLPACGFCDGSGLWPDPEAGPGAGDPCPLCEGSGKAPEAVAPGAAIAADADPVARLEALLPTLTPVQRQRLYEVLYRRYDCRIYR